jgi:hypothetical protein
MHQNVLAGFAGDVQIGFALLEALARELPAFPSDEPPAVAVSELIDGFSERARDVFKSAPLINRSQGSELLMPGERLPRTRSMGACPRSHVYAGRSSFQSRLIAASGAQSAPGPMSPNRYIVNLRGPAPVPARQRPPGQPPLRCRQRVDRAFILPQTGAALPRAVRPAELTPSSRVPRLGLYFI